MLARRCAGVCATTSSRLLLPRAQPSLLRLSLRRCTTQAQTQTASTTASSTASTQTAKAAATRSAGSGVKRKDWRVHGDVVFERGVPVKGSLHKLPWRDQFVHCVVFSVAGCLAVYLVKPQIRYLCHHGFLGLSDDAGWRNGPWLYRALYVCVMMPSYSMLLLLSGCLFSRRVWFSFMVHKMWSRLLPRSASNQLLRILDIAHY